MANKSRSRADKLVEAKRLYYLHPGGLTDIELARLMEVDIRTAYLVRNQIGAEKVSKGHYSIIPTADDIELARAILSRANV